VRGHLHEVGPSEHCSSRLGPCGRVVELAKGDMMQPIAGGAHTGNPVRGSKYLFADSTSPHTATVLSHRTLPAHAATAHDRRTLLLTLLPHTVTTHCHRTLPPHTGAALCCLTLPQRNRRTLLPLTAATHCHAPVAHHNTRPRTDPTPPRTDHISPRTGACTDAVTQGRGHATWRLVCRSSAAGARGTLSRPAYPA
jgi:hypothetical protein